MFAVYQLVYFAGLVIKVAKDAGFLVAGLHTIRQLALFDSILAKITFLDDAFLFVESAGAVRAGHYTSQAADALITIHPHYPIATLL
jgi:hypothetical protein